MRALVVALIGLTGLQACVLGEDVDDESATEQFVRPPPNNVIATPTSPSRITVSWDAVVMATKYYVYQSVAGGPFLFKGTTLAPGTSLQVANLAPMTMYCYQVITDGPDGAGPASAPPACATTPGMGTAPPPPTGVTAVATASDRITVSWNAVAMATRYFVYQSVGPAGPFTFQSTVLAPAVSLNVANLQPATNYCYTVQSETAGGVSVQSAPPACANTFALGLEGYWKLNDGTGTTAIDSSGKARDGTLTGAASFSTDFAPLDNNAFALLGPGGTGDSVSVPDAAPLWLTGNFTVAAWVKSGGGAGPLIGKRVGGCGTVNWEVAQDATNMLHIKGNGGAALSFGQSLPVDVWTHVGVTFAGGTARTYINGAETASGAYTVGPRSGDPMQIGNAGGCGGSANRLDEVRVYSRELSAVEMAAIGTRPPSPTGFTATAVSSTRINLSWNAVPGAFKYFLKKGMTMGGTTFFTSIIAPTTSFSDNLNPPGTTVFYVVHSVQNGLISDPAPEQSATTNPPPAQPMNVTAMQIGTMNRIALSWSAVTNATKYFVMQSVNGGAFTFKTTVLAPGTSVEIANLTVGSTYSYQIIAQDVAGTNSVPSAATTPITVQ